jgi:hypothetical protein
MKKVNYILMVLAFLSAGFSIFLNVNNGYSAWVWQLATMLWIINSFIQQRTIQRYERND